LFVFFGRALGAVESGGTVFLLSIIVYLLGKTIQSNESGITYV